MTRTFRLLLVPLLAAGLVATAAMLWHQSDRFLASYWQDQLETANDERIEDLLEKIAELGDAGIPVLVDALDSDRPGVAFCAKQVLWDKIEHWKTGPAADRSRHLERFVLALAKKVEPMSPAAQRHAVALIGCILEGLEREPASLTEASRAACQKVLRLGGTLGPLPTAPAEGGSSAPGGTTAASTSEPPQADPSPQPSARFSDGDDSAAPLLRPEPDDFTQKIPTSTRDPVVAGPQELPQGIANRPLSRVREPRHSNVEGDRAPDPFTNSVRSLGQRLDDGLASVETLPLMRRLSSEREAPEAEAELRRRGFRPSHLDLARQLFHRDPEVRKQLVRRLPETQGIDAAPWLLQLAVDEDPAVRLAALGLLATTADPELLARVRQLAENDPDPRVQRQAERLGGPSRVTRRSAPERTE